VSDRARPSVVLVTGGAGFIGVNFIRWLLTTDSSVRVINLDALTYAGNLESLADVTGRFGPAGDARYYFVHGDIRDVPLVQDILAGRGVETPAGDAKARRVPAVEAVVHMAAESHVDRSIMGPAAFVDTNVRGTLALLEACRSIFPTADKTVRFLHVSTDEVYGSLGPTDPAFTESTPLAPNSPYSASKAGSDLLVRAYVETFKFPAVTTRCSNNYGPYQFPEKLIPLMVTRALSDQPLPVYGDGRNVRDWLYVEDHASAIWAALTRGRIGEVYNVGGGAEHPNIDIVKRILGILGKPESLIQFVADRPGHDRRYAMNHTKLSAECGWRPSHGFGDGLAHTVAWYVEHRGWWERVVSEAYRATNALYLRQS